MRHNLELTDLAQNLRRNMTKEERKLWYDYLSQYPVRFRRQVTFERYILDFYCASAKVCVELDGAQHYDEVEMAKDQVRTAFLEHHGIHVLRFSNLDVLKNLRGVCAQIDLVVKQRLQDLSRQP